MQPRAEEVAFLCILSNDALSPADHLGRPLRREFPNPQPPVTTLKRSGWKSSKDLKIGNCAFAFMQPNGSF